MNQVWYNNFYFIFKLCITVPTLGELGYIISIVLTCRSKCIVRWSKSLFRNKILMLDEMILLNNTNFAIFLIWTT